MIKNNIKYDYLKKIKSFNYKTNEKIFYYKNTLGIYGPKLWYLIHYFALLSDLEKLHKEYITFIECIKNLFPCGICKKHFGENLLKHNIDNYTSNLLKWSCLMHNEVNKSNKKKEIVEEECLSIYSKEINSDSDIYFNNIIYVLYTLASTYKIENFKYFKCIVIIFGIFIKENYKESYQDSLKLYNIDDYKENNETMFKWVYLINNNINKTLKIPSLDYYNLKHFFLNVL